MDLQQEYENHPDPDETLIARIKAGDYPAFSTLYEKYIRSLTQYGLRFTKDSAIIEDCLHDLFVWLWTKRAVLDIKSSLRAYLLKSLRTAIVHRLNADTRKGLTRMDTDIEDAGYGFGISPEDIRVEQEKASEQQKRVADILDLLTGKQREVIYLRFYEQLNFEQIAAHMDLSVKACYKLAGRAMAVLRGLALVMLIILLRVLTAAKDCL